jgi:hypothetical protein
MRQERPLVSFAPLDPDAVAFLSEETGVDFRSVEFDRPEWFCASARNAHGAVIGVLAAEFKSWFDADISVAVADPACLSWRVLHAIFVALFSTARRVTARIDPTNRPAIEQAFKLGFEVEGYLKRGLDGRRDAYLFGMTKETCRWLKPRRRASLWQQTVRQEHGYRT